MCPEGAACIAAARTLAQAGWISPGESVVVLNTGTVLQYPGPVAVSAPTVRPDGALDRYDSSHAQAG
jgi:threonine synthase